MEDHGFKKLVAWDIPMTDGYEYELVPNTSNDPGTHHFFGLKNPALVELVMAWKPDAVHVTGWAWFSHLWAIWEFYRREIPTLFRGDSHLLDNTQFGFRWWAKRMVLKHVFSWPTAFLYVGRANRAYYEAFGVKNDRLFKCPHSIDVDRFAGAPEVFENEAERWRLELGISPDKIVLLFAGKFEHKKRPLELIRAIQGFPDPRLVLVLVGNGELDVAVNACAIKDPERLRVLPFQNQSRMPVVYRMGDLFTLPSAYGETWGLAVNEAMACGRAVLVSDRVGCAEDLVDASCGRVFPWADLSALVDILEDMAADRKKLTDMGRAAAERAWQFNITSTENALVKCLKEVCKQ